MEFNRNFPYGAGQNERAIEIPWALSKYHNEAKVLEVGCSFAYENPEYVPALLGLNIPELHGLDISSRDAPDFIKKTADIRQSGYETGFFDLVLCISTLEHVGMDNTKYYLPVAELPREAGDAGQPGVDAVAEMFRILKAGGKLLVTVPFGRFVNYGWFLNYDAAAVANLFRHLPSAEIAAEYFKYTPAGWLPCTADELATIAYRDNTAPAAAGIACFEIIKPLASD